MRRKTFVIIALIAIVVLFVSAIAVVAAVALIARGGGISIGDKVGLIRVEGVITSGRGSRGLLADGSAGAETIVDLLEQFRKDKAVKTLVLRINSPGGSAAGSQEIYQAIINVRKDGKKVVVSMGDVAASGGYYIASAGDTIYADPATLTGSIGVIMETADLHALLGKLGIDVTTIKSGEHKDIGSFSRPMTQEEKRILQALIDDVHDQFISDVSAGRKRLNKEQVKALADGRIFTGRQAVRLKLVDKTGTLQDAFRTAAREAGIKGEYSIVEYGRSSGIIGLLFGSAESRTVTFPGRYNRLGELAQKFLRMDSVAGISE